MDKLPQGVPQQEIVIRSELRPGDIGRVVEQHGEIYAREYGFDATFEAYVAATIGEFAKHPRPARDGLWLAESGGRLLGSVGIVGQEDGAAQFRWFLVAPEARGRGVGRRLGEVSLAFCRNAGYRTVFLWTVDPLIDAARLYKHFGFRLAEETPTALLWGQTLREQRYDLTL